jgi:hypothetical protein
MAFWEHIRQAAIASRVVEEEMYAQVLREIESGVRRDGLWAKALQNSGGNEEKARALYIKYRIRSINDELEIRKDLSTPVAAVPKEQTKQITTDYGHELETADASRNESESGTAWIHVLVWLLAAILVAAFLLNS